MGYHHQHGHVISVGKTGGWVRVHVTVKRIELDEKTVAGLVSLRLPTPAELVEAEPGS